MSDSCSGSRKRWSGLDSLFRVKDDLSGYNTVGRRVREASAVLYVSLSVCLLVTPNSLSPSVFPTPPPLLLLLLVLLARPSNSAARRRQKQRIVVVREDWSVVCYDHQLNRLWKTPLEHEGLSPGQAESFVIDQVCVSALSLSPSPSLPLYFSFATPIRSKHGRQSTASRIHNRTKPQTLAWSRAPRASFPAREPIIKCHQDQRQHMYRQQHTTQQRQEQVAITVTHSVRKLDDRGWPKSGRGRFEAAEGLVVVGASLRHRDGRFHHSRVGACRVQPRRAWPCLVY